MDIWTGLKNVLRRSKNEEVSEPPVGVNILKVLIMTDNIHEFQPPQVKHFEVTFDCSLAWCTSLPSASPGGSASTTGRHPTARHHFCSPRSGPRRPCLILSVAVPQSVFLCPPWLSSPLCSHSSQNYHSETPMRLCYFSVRNPPVASHVTLNGSRSPQMTE